MLLPKVGNIVITRDENDLERCFSPGMNFVTHKLKVGLFNIETTGGLVLALRGQVCQN